MSLSRFRQFLISSNTDNLHIDTPMHVTQNGKQIHVVQHSKIFHEQQEILALLKLINLSERSANPDGYLSLDAAFAI